MTADLDGWYSTPYKINAWKVLAKTLGDEYADLMDESFAHNHGPVIIEFDLANDSYIIVFRGVELRDNLQGFPSEEFLTKLRLLR